MAVATVEIQVNGQGAVRNLRQISAESKNTENALDGLKRAAAGVAFVALGRQVVQAAASYKDLQLRLKLLTSEYGEYGRAQAFAAASAKKFGLSNREAATGVTDIYARLRPLGVSLKDIQSTFTGFNTVAKLSGVSAEGASSAFAQLGQALGSGALQGDEFRSIGEQVPGILVAVSKETGIATKDLKKFASDGLLSADIVIRALKKIETEGAGKLATLIQASDTQKFKDLSNAVDDLQISIGEQLLPIVLPLVQDLVSLTKAVAEIPEPIKKTTAETVKLVVELVLLKKAFDAIIGIRAALLGTLGAVATTTAATGTAAKSSASAFALYTSNVKTLEAAAAASTTKVAGLLRVVGSLAAIGGIVITVDLIVKGIGDVIAATREIMRLRGVRAGGGAAAQFAGASRETVVDAQKDQKKILAGIQRSQKANELNAGQKLAQTVLGALSPLVGLPTAGQQAQRAQLYKEQARFSQGVLGLDPMQFKETTPTTQDTNTSTGTGTGTEKSGKKKKAEDFTEQIANSGTMLGLARSQFDIEGKILEARVAENTQLVLNLEAQKQLLQVNADIAKIKADKDMPAAKKKAELDILAIQANTINRQLNFDITAFQKQAIDSYPGYISGIMSAASGYSTILEYSKQLTVEQQKQKDLADGIANTVGQGMVSAFDALISGTESFGASLRNIASGVLKDIAMQLLRIYVINQAINAISSFFGPKTPAGAGFGGFNPASFSMGSLSGGLTGATNFSSAFVPKALGGPVSAGSSYMVGERGPELFTPKHGGSIVPNNALGGGSTSVVVNVDASGSNVQGDQAQAKQLGVAVSAAVQAELVKQQRPGGLLAGTRR